MPAPRNRQPYVRGKNAPKPQIGRLLKELFTSYKFHIIIVLICLILSAVSNTASSIFLNQIVDVVEKALKVFNNQGDKAALTFAKPELIRVFALMAVIFVAGIIATTIQGLCQATVTQGFLAKMREKMFSKMESLPIKYFDQHKHGDIMSHYTNDIDTLRQLISQSLPQMLSSALTLLFLFAIMLYLSVWMTILVLLGVGVMLIVVKKIGGKSAKYFISQQESLGTTEGYIEEMITGQKVVKVFCHEEKAEEGFNKVNDKLADDATKANIYGNILMPILGNIGNILYIFVAFVGAALILAKVPNLSLSGQAMTIAVVVPFLSMTRQFCQSISGISQQINAVAMAMAGASRIYEIIDEKPETDDGYVKLVNAEYNKNNELTETDHVTHIWAWKHPHQADGTVSYKRLTGDVVLDHVDFGYTPEKLVLHDISIHAKPGQKIAFVGATGAGKTTITNLINRFYDIADGKIRYDGININKIKKADLRHSLGIVLQDVNLFTGTVMDNIRYGKLDATDEECIAAAKLANADDFITRLPQGYDTVITGNAANLSQGQRQLISIARAAVADPPVMILDEATSSIDTRTEKIVSEGMDRLMEGRTVFVIAHRLSTVQNSDVIMVLDHGHIIESGSHDELIAQHGSYYQLYTGAFELE